MTIERGNYCTNCEDYTSHSKGIDFHKKPGIRCDECGHFNWKKEGARVTIQINSKTFQELKKAYSKAVETKAETFELPFLPGPLLTAYAKYMIEYLEPKFERAENGK